MRDLDELKEAVCGAAEHVEIVGHYASWFDTLYTTIKSEIEAGRYYQASQLADIGQFLTDEFSYQNESSKKAFNLEH